MMETLPRIPRSEREFLDLRGDFSESVQLTFPGERRPGLTGWYVFIKEGEKNTFVRKSSGSELIDIIGCETKYLQFDRNMGVMPNSHYYNYQPLGPRNQEKYEEMKKRLLAVGEWKERTAS